MLYYICFYCVRGYFVCCHYILLLGNAIFVVLVLLMVLLLSSFFCSLFILFFGIASLDILLLLVLFIIGLLFILILFAPVLVYYYYFSSSLSLLLLLLFSLSDMICCYPFDGYVLLFLLLSVNLFWLCVCTADIGCVCYPCCLASLLSMRKEERKGPHFIRASSSSSSRGHKYRPFILIIVILYYMYSIHEYRMCPSEVSNYGTLTPAARPAGCDDF